LFASDGDISNDNSENAKVFKKYWDHTWKTYYGVATMEASKLGHKKIEKLRKRTINGEVVYLTEEEEQGYGIVVKTDSETNSKSYNVK
jgi:hypothetical protein